MRFELLAQGKVMCISECMDILSDCFDFDHRSEAGNDRELETVSAEQTQVLLRCG